METITKTQFEEYERIKATGAVNMFNRSHVVEMSAGTLDKNDIKIIQDNYEELTFKYASI
jgi:hypothetical protein